MKSAGKKKSIKPKHKMYQNLRWKFRRMARMNVQFEWQCGAYEQNDEKNSG